MARQAEVAKVVRLAIRPPASEQTDRELIAQYVSGDEKAFAAIVARHSGLVFGLCRRLLPTVQDAEDASQATFLILAKKAKSTHWQASIANWLYTTAWQIASTLKKSARHRIHQALPTEKGGEPCLLDQMSGREVFQVLDEELSKLPPRYREPLVLCYLQGLTRDEAAAQLAVPVATLKSQLDRARKRLHSALTRRGIAPALSLVALDAFAPVQASSTFIHSILTAQEAPSAAVAQLVKGIAVNSWIKKAILSTAAMLGMAALGVTTFTLQADPKQPSKDHVAQASEPKGATKEGKNENVDKDQIVQGKVIGPDGKPLAGAKLYTYEATEDEGLRLKPLGVTKQDGTFEVSWMSTLRRNWLIAYQEGVGIAWTRRDEEQPSEIKLQIPKDMPVTGRVVNAEGKPVLGATVRLLQLSEGRMDDYLQRLQNEMKGISVAETPPALSRLYLNDLIVPVRTDSLGEFTLRGVGTERLARIQVKGKGIADETIYIVTRPQFEAETFTGQLSSLQQDSLDLPGYKQFHSSDSTIRVKTSLVLEGIIRAADTQLPLANCKVTMVLPQRVEAGLPKSSLLEASTETDGCYRLEGIPEYLPRDSRGELQIDAPAGTTYVKQAIPFKTLKALKTGSSTIHLDTQLARGVKVRGRVVEKGTGKGARGNATLTIIPGNKHFNVESICQSYTAALDAEGRFELVTVPGKAFLEIDANGPEKILRQTVSPYRLCRFDPDHPELFHRMNIMPGLMMPQHGYTHYFQAAAVKMVDVKADGETAVDLTIDRGHTATIEVQDPQGKPFKGAVVAGLTEIWPNDYRLPEAQHLVYALDPQQPRLVVAYDPVGKRIGSTLVRGDEKNVVPIRLGEFATMKGLAFKTDPQSEATVSFQYSSDAASLIHSQYLTPKQPLKVDAEGRFTITNIIPGAPGKLVITLGKQALPSGDPQTLKPGETLDLGLRLPGW